jgi:hypothetical protein
LTTTTLVNEDEKDTNTNNTTQPRGNRARIPYGRWRFGAFVDLQDWRMFCTDRIPLLRLYRSLNFEELSYLVMSELKIK